MTANSIICGVRGCQRRFKTEYNAERHRRLHDERGKYICEKCDKRFIELSSLSNHKRRHLRSGGATGNSFSSGCALTNELCSRESPLSGYIRNADNGNGEGIRSENEKGKVENFDKFFANFEE